VPEPAARSTDPACRVVSGERSQAASPLTAPEFTSGSTCGEVEFTSL
jgi:hypothetical protein